VFLSFQYSAILLTSPLEELGGILNQDSGLVCS